MNTFLGAIKKEQKYFILKRLSGGSDQSLAIGKKLRVRYKNRFDEIRENKISMYVFYQLQKSNDYKLIPTNYAGFLNIK